MRIIFFNRIKVRNGQGSRYWRLARHALEQLVETVSHWTVVWFKLQSLRNAPGGHLKPDPYSFISHLAAEYGTEAAAEVAEFERAHIDAIRELVRTEKIDCDFVLTNAIDVQLLPEECRNAKADFDRLGAAGVKSVSRVGFYGQKDAEEVSRLELESARINC